MLHDDRGKRQARQAKTAPPSVRSIPTKEGERSEELEVPITLEERGTCSKCGAKNVLRGDCIP